MGDPAAKLAQQRAILAMVNPPPAPRRTRGRVVTVVAILLLLGAVVVAVVLLLRKKAGAVPVAKNPRQGSIPKGTQITSPQLAQFTMGVQVIDSDDVGASASITERVIGTLPSLATSVGGSVKFGRGAGVVGSTMSWTPEPPPPGAGGPALLPPGATRGFVPGTLKMVHGVGLLRTNMYLAPNRSTGAVGWSPEKTFVGLFPANSAKTAFFIAFLGQGTQPASWAVPWGDNENWTLNSQTGTGSGDGAGVNSDGKPITLTFLAA